jgi:hypothetical protein
MAVVYSSIHKFDTERTLDYPLFDALKHVLRGEGDAGHKKQAGLGVKLKLRWFENLPGFSNIGCARVTSQKFNTKKNFVQQFAIQC